MKVILFGATGMVGQGVLRECLAEPDVQGVLSIGRGTTVTTTEEVGRAMLRVARDGADKRLLENQDIARIARQTP